MRRLAFVALLLATAPAAAAPAVNVTTSRVEVDQAPSISSDLLFEVGEARLKKDAAAILDEVAKAIIKENKSNLVIDVHTDDVGPDGDRSGGWLAKLSQARADAIKTYLSNKGVPGRRLTARGRGFDAPITSNASDDGRRANRRVELIVEIEVRPPVQADLAMYLKKVPGQGPLLLATIDTSQGTLHCQLYEDKAPMTVANFVGLATGQKSWTDKAGKTVKGKPFYDGLVFHRVIPGFMIQGGDPLGLGTGGPGYTFGDEINRDARNVPGAMAMANAGPNTNGSQFFIDEVRSPHLDGRHTVFGLCRETEVVSKIANVPRDSGDKPSTPVVIKRVTISRSTPPPPPPDIGPRPR